MERTALAELFKGIKVHKVGRIIAFQFAQPLVNQLTRPDDRIAGLGALYLIDIALSGQHILMPFRHEMRGEIVRRKEAAEQRLAAIDPVDIVLLEAAETDVHTLTAIEELLVAALALHEDPEAEQPMAEALQSALLIVSQTWNLADVQSLVEKVSQS